MSSTTGATASSGVVPGAESHAEKNTAENSSTARVGLLTEPTRISQRRASRGWEAPFGRVNRWGRRMEYRSDRKDGMPFRKGSSKRAVAMNVSWQGYSCSKLTVDGRAGKSPSARLLPNIKRLEAETQGKNEQAAQSQYFPAWCQRFHDRYGRMFNADKYNDE
jgi:hypothetical protein